MILLFTQDAWNRRYRNNVAFTTSINDEWGGERNRWDEWIWLILFLVIIIGILLFG